MMDGSGATGRVGLGCELVLTVVRVGKVGKGLGMVMVAMVEVGRKCCGGSW